MVYKSQCSRKFINVSPWMNYRWCWFFSWAVLYSWAKEKEGYNRFLQRASRLPIRYREGLLSLWRYDWFSIINGWTVYALTTSDKWPFKIEDYNNSSNISHISLESRIRQHRITLPCYFIFIQNKHKRRCKWRKTGMSLSIIDSEHPTGPMCSNRLSIHRIIAG